MFTSAIAITSKLAWEALDAAPQMMRQSFRCVNNQALE